MGLLAGIGCIATACSNSHKQILNLYCQNKKPLKKKNSKPQPIENKPNSPPKRNKTRIKLTDQTAALLIQEKF